MHAWLRNVGYNALCVFECNSLIGKASSSTSSRMVHACFCTQLHVPATCGSCTHVHASQLAHVSVREVRKCEKPLYTVIRPLGSRRNWWDGKSPAELRQYAPMLIAQVAGQSILTRGTWQCQHAIAVAAWCCRCSCICLGQTRLHPHQ
jgi:hypothetical protein